MLTIFHGTRLNNEVYQCLCMLQDYYETANSLGLSRFMNLVFKSRAVKRKKRKCINFPEFLAQTTILLCYVNEINEKYLSLPFVREKLSSVERV